MERELAEKLVKLFSEAHALLCEAAVGLPEAPKDTELYDLKKRIAGVMVDLHQRLQKPIYKLYPELQPRSPTEEKLSS